VPGWRHRRFKEDQEQKFCKTPLGRVFFYLPLPEISPSVFSPGPLLAETTFQLANRLFPAVILFRLPWSRPWPPVSLKNQFSCSNRWVAPPGEKKKKKRGRGPTLPARKPGPKQKAAVKRLPHGIGGKWPVKSLASFVAV